MAGIRCCGNTALSGPGFGAAPGSMPASNPSAGRPVQHVRVHAMAGMRWS